MARRRNPFDEIEEMFERMSRQFEGMGRQLESGGMDLQSGGMSLDMADRGDEFVVTADLPGFRKEDIDLTLRDDRLRIAAQHEEETEEGDEEYIRKERSRRSMNRTVTLPDRVDESNVSAEYRNGVLTVTLPKADGSDESHDIEVS
ncbi:Hsp20/alpha crystallin family protein [Haladaptatus salinisoli]|uniref:Hsp20/alpha crystallin family protein n=1 Tax=Haladaptatus salinisoli TaxID=2884876 RepID=UPI001D0AE0AF|nr:Hsp20/alpha crystallin family protein [Haladaptatus salinisoli]